jgi:hypothetical protein
MKFTIPKSLIGKNGITGEEKTWAQIADVLNLDYTNQSAHRVVASKSPEIHKLICGAECNYNGDKPVKPKAEKDKTDKGKADKSVKKIVKKPVKATGMATCQCGAVFPVEYVSLVTLTPALTGGKAVPSTIYCLNCAVTKLMA